MSAFALFPLAANCCKLALPKHKYPVIFTLLSSMMHAGKLHVLYSAIGNTDMQCVHNINKLQYARH